MLTKNTRGFSRVLGKKTKLAIIIAVTILVVSTIFLETLFSNQFMFVHENNLINNNVENSREEKRVLIYDPLSREYSNPELIDLLMKTFTQHNYTVDIYIGKNATLDPLYHLDRYDIIILRAHGGYNNNSKIPEPVGQYVFTGIYFNEAIKIYGKNKIYDLLKHHYIVKGVIPRNGVSIYELPLYVVVSPLFFKDKISSLKNDTIIIYTGCYGLDDDVLANIFLDKGAYAYLSFKGNVTLVFGDQILEIIPVRIAKGEDIVEIYKSLNETQIRDPYTGAELEIRYRK